ncbi:MAG TPA: multifunctional CCA addition/repair protein [Candidatus Desulfobacillus sp.]|nr:multifunctional CCA addition/repair protein [Candidatus Desulfobacillus sp.]
MKTYVVGGAVRDRLLGLPVQDRDHVVVGATPEEMLARGFRPVGRDFPVFLHPETQEEYALARTERKSAPGYRGFVFHAAADVTLEQDLARRDLTINAIAEDESGALVDPFGGRADLAARRLRHVGPAFAEDPVRVLRVARFAARFADFAVAEETLALMRAMSDSGEVDHLVPERVWQELARGLMEARPSRMIALLRECGALARILPEVDRLFGVPQPAEHHPEIDTGVHVLRALDLAAARRHGLTVRYAVLLHDLGKGQTPPAEWPRHHSHEAAGAALAAAVSARLRAPTDCRDLAVLTAREHGLVHDAAALRPATIVDLLMRADALRRPRRFGQLLEACECDFRGRPGWEERPWPAGDLLRRALQAAQGVDAGAIAAATADKARIAERVREARVAAVRQALRPAGGST